MSASRIPGLMVALLCLAMGCSSSKKIDVGSACEINSDCNQGLVCTWGKCHVACRTSADCQPGQSCIIVNDQSTVCVSPASCIYNSDCATGLLCAVDQQCRKPCQTDVDCTSGQTCTSTQTCAELSQVDSKNNLFVPDGGLPDGGVSGIGGASGSGGSISPTPDASPDLSTDVYMPGSAGSSGGSRGETGAGGSISSTPDASPDLPVDSSGSAGGSGGSRGVTGAGGSISLDSDASLDLPADLPVEAFGSDAGIGTALETAGGTRDTGSSEGSTGTNASLWYPTEIPSSFCTWDPGPVEIGTGFWSDTSGNALAVRFFKDPLNTGLHSGRLWNAAGVLLAEATFTAETNSGWQEAPFSVSVPVTAGARYVVSFHSTTGYSYDSWSDVDRPPLHANAGYYCYGDPPCFPSNVASLNYWVDIVLSQ